MNVKRIINEPVPSNCYVLYNKAEGGNCVVVDPGSRDNTKLLNFLNENNLSPKYIVLTHEHFDHIWGVNEIVERYQVPIVCSELCSYRIKDSFDNCSAMYDDMMAVIINSPVVSIESLGNELQMGGEWIRFYSTPGHSNACVSLLVDGYLFTGDALIKDLKTVTKLPTGSKRRQKETIETLRELQGHELLVYPGHGDPFQLDGYDLQKSL